MINTQLSLVAELSTSPGIGIETSCFCKYLFKTFVQSLSDGPPQPVRIKVAATIGARTLDNFINNLSRKKTKFAKCSILHTDFRKSREYFAFLRIIKRQKKEKATENCNLL